VLYDPSGRGGICQYSYNLAQGLAGKGARVTVVAPDSYELAHLPRRFTLKRIFKRSWAKSLLESLRPGLGEAAAGSPSARGVEERDRAEAPAGGLRGLRELRLRWMLGRLATSLRIRRPDVFHVQWLVAHEQEWRMLERLRSAGIPLVHTAHDILPHGGASAEERAFFGRLYGFVDRVIVHTERNRDELLELFGLPRSATAVIPHGSFSSFAGSSVTKEAARREIGIPERAKVILFFGLIKRYKGLEYLTEAFARVRAKVEGATLVIAGRVATEDPESGPFYGRLLQELEGSSDVRVFPEFIPFSRVPLFFAAADVVALPYVKTYQSGVLLWAYGAGRPVITTDTGGLAESVVEGESGRVVPARDSRALAEALVQVLGSPGEAERMGAAAKNLADTRHSWNHVAAQTLELYSDLSSGAARTRRAETASARDAEPRAEGASRRGDGLCPP
jgi:D-inositol-3-phosphate glycosyltransferase